jgi:hypothetical protein
MQPTRNMKIANLEVTIILLQKEERRMQEIISSTLTAPEIRQQAQFQLGLTLAKIKDAADELTRIQQGE